MALLVSAARRGFLQMCEELPEGRLEVITPEGDRLGFGEGSGGAEIELKDWRAVRALAAHGPAGLGAAYAAGFWETPSLEGVGRALGALEGFEPRGWQTWPYRAADRLGAWNARLEGNEFYQLWLDEGMNFSAALFAGEDDLALAQARKMDRVLARVSGKRLLDIGCGWGAFAERAAEAGREVTALAERQPQKGFADARLDGRALVALGDAGSVEGQFDAVVALESQPDFAAVKARLATGGRALVQAVTVPDAEYDGAQVHLTRGVSCDALLTTGARQAELKIEERFAFGPDYARTLRHWAARMRENAERIKSHGYSEALLRGWQFALGTGAARFAAGCADVVQLELVHA